MIEVEFLRPYTVAGTPYAAGDIASLDDETARMLLVSFIAGYAPANLNNRGPRVSDLFATRFTSVSLNSYGLTASTPDIKPLIEQAIADGWRHVVIPKKPYTITWATKLVASDLTIEFEEGAEVTLTMLTEAANLTRTRFLGPVRFTSPFAGADMDAGDATGGDYGTDTIFARLFSLNDDCSVIGSWFQERCAGGLKLNGRGFRGLASFEFSDMRHRNGWASCIHADGAASSDNKVTGPVYITDCDRGIEVEDGASDALFSGGGKLLRVYPKPYAGQPGNFSTYTFALDAHAHAGSGGVSNIRYLGGWTFEDCGGAVTFVSSGTDPADMPRNCYVDHVRIIGRSVSSGYEDIAMHGFGNEVGSAEFEVGAGIAGGNFRIAGGAGSAGNKIGRITPKTAAAKPVVTDQGSGLYRADTNTDVLSTVGDDPGVIALISAGGNQTWPTANQAMLVKVRAKRDMTIGKLIWNVGSSAGNYDIGIYDGDGTRLWSKGSTPVPASGSVVTETVAPGVSILKDQVFYVGMNNDVGNTFTLKGGITSSTEFTKTLVGKGITLGFTNSFPLPATLDVRNSTNFPSRVPLVTIREA